MPEASRTDIRRRPSGKLSPKRCGAIQPSSFWAKTLPRPAHRSKFFPGLVEEFGKDRVLDTPISEAGFTGLAVGAAMTGMRPVVDIMFGDFIGLTMDQMVNQAAKIHYMSGGKWKVPDGDAHHDGRHAAFRVRSIRSRCMRGSAMFPD